jgi:hydroxyacylglutathione hydrolase
MLLERFEDPELAQYSYAVADESAGVMAVVDPRRDVEVYLGFAAAHGLTIEAVLETHIHADYASGARELGERAGAPVYTSAHDRGEDYEVAYLDPALGREAFVERILGSVPPFPAYYRRMKELNAAGPPLLADRPPPPALPPRRFCRRLEGDAVALDLRDQLAYGGGHVPGSFGLGADGDLSRWAAWVVPYETPILLVAERPGEVGDAARRLARVGLDRVDGWLEGGIAAWREAGLPLLEIAQRTPRQLHTHLAAGEAIHVLDVRSDEEWEAGHVAGALHVMAGELTERLDEVPDDGRPLALVCASGYRSTVAASLLERAGRSDLINVTGGMGAWRQAGLPITAG